MKHTETLAILTTNIILNSLILFAIALFVIYIIIGTYILLRLAYNYYFGQSDQMQMELIEQQLPNTDNSTNICITYD